jgi:eukaryotic-like serine/threonine-protein kinase
VTQSEPYKYWAFISYSHADAGWAAWLHRALESYRIPARLVGQDTPFGPIPKKLFPIFRDRDELAGSAELGPELEKALRQSRYQIVIASPNAARSRWVDEEIRQFKALGRASRVLALIIDGEPHATGKNDPERECFPAALRFQVDSGGRLTDVPAEPIAADARRSADGRGNAKLKLIAGLLGVGFDELRRRELQARNRRLAFLAAGASAISAVTIVLAALAYEARNDALRRQQQAEDLLQFMLGDLRDKLEPIGKLSILDAVGQKAIDYFKTLDESDLTDTALASRATALRQIGAVRIKQGDLEGASLAFNEALRLDEELVKRHPGDPAFIKNVGESESTMGLGHYVKGEMDRARPWLERYAVTAERLAALEPDNPEWTNTLVLANMNLGALGYARKDLDAAHAAFTLAAAKQQELVRTRPQDRTYLETLADLYGWLCSVESARRAWDKAVEQATRQADLQRQLVELAPDNANYQYGLAAASIRVLRSESQLRPLAPEAPALREVLRRTEALVALDPENIEFRYAQVVALTFLLDAHLTRDDARATSGAARQVLDKARELYARAPASAEIIDQLLNVLGQTAKLALLHGNTLEARARSGSRPSGHRCSPN